MFSNSKAGKNNLKSGQVKIVSMVASLLLFSGLTNAEASSKYLNCNTDDVKCYTIMMDKKIAQSKDINTVLETFDEIAKNTNGINGQCNNFGRYLGRKLYEKHKDQVLKYHNYSCGEPYTYGFMESMGREGKIERSLLTKKLVKYCQADKYPDMCAYGVGISQSSSSATAGEVQKSCELNFPSDAVKKTLPYEVRAEGICLLGWVSGKNSVLPASYFKSIKSAMSICDGSYKDGKLSCLAEATFAYTYVGNPSSPERIKRVFELKDRCKSDTSSMCYRFIGKALDDYFLYSVQLDLNNKKQSSEASSLVSKLCDKGSEYCIEGLVNAHVVHRSKEDMTLLCNSLEAKFKKICLSKIIK